jgi:hypothetical protein
MYNQYLDPNAFFFLFFWIDVIVNILRSSPRTDGMQPGDQKIPGYLQRVEIEVEAARVVVRRKSLDSIFVIIRKVIFYYDEKIGDKIP